MLINPLSMSDSVRRMQLNRLGTLRRLIDAIVAHLFLHSYNRARVRSHNLGRAISMSSLRDLTLKYIGTKTHNSGYRNRESQSLRRRDAQLLEDYHAKWTIERVIGFISKVEDVAKGWRAKVIASK